MKNPALTGGVSLQFKLRLTRLLLALVLDIVPNRGLVDAHLEAKNPRAQTPPPSQYTLRNMCGNFSFNCRLVTLFRGSPPLLKPRTSAESPCEDDHGPVPFQSPPETNRGEIPARLGEPSSHILPPRARGFFADTASPTPNGTGSSTPHGPVDGVSSTTIIIAPGEQQMAPSSHPPLPDGELPRN